MWTALNSVEYWFGREEIETGSHYVGLVRPQTHYMVQAGHKFTVF